MRPDSKADVTVVLPVTTKCGAQGSICTQDGRKLSNSLKPEALEDLAGVG